MVPGTLVRLLRLVRLMPGSNIWPSASAQCRRR